VAADAIVTRYLTRGGVRIYRFRVETFSSHFNNIYLILDGPDATLFDVGSGLPDSNAGLEAAMHEMRERFGESIRLDQIPHVVISHAHVDHFGHVGYFARETDAEVYVHELDARVLENFEERIVLAAKDLRVFLERAGLGAPARAELEEMYRFSKSFFKSVRCDVRLRDGDRIVNGYVVHHVPGHCPGQICLEVDDVLLTADHVLSRITPHQSPASITPFCGLELYLASLAKIRQHDGVRLALPGHEDTIAELAPRIDGITAHHTRRLHQVLDICREPATLADVSRRLFGERGGYTRLLALEEAGAHVEYLFQRGELGIANLDQVAREANPVIYYELRKP
jgi:glyoxylase-like metal-dependent hydrolase (beta-lactamase superfamily II)